MVARVEREERTALCRETERDRKPSNSLGATVQQGVSFNRQIVTKREHVEIREGKQEGSLESFCDCYRVPNCERPGGELEDSYCRYSRRKRKYTDTVWPQDARSEEENSEWTTEGATSWETGEQAERVEEDWGRQTSEPWYKSSMEKSPVTNLTREEKTQTRISGDDGDDEELYIPLGGGVKGRSGQAHTGVGGEVVQPDIHGEKEKRKVEKDTRLQGAKRGSAGKTHQDGFTGDSGGTHGGERLDDHSGHIECIPACKGGRTIQSPPVLQLSESMLRLRRDALWSEGRALSIHEDNLKGSLVHQRTVEDRYAIEINHAGYSTVPEKSGLDTFGREIELVTNKERGVFGMAVEFREDGADALREEESSAAGGRANLDCICKEMEESKDKRAGSTPLEAEFCEAATPTSKLVD
ncbi:uncharacterized protein MONOS_9942 [Monocercomonoides exilis]|uniref:uncharacterized protein n=1 Tax=Monocercomonoides exilis TaxID=2049356 RepID=UPI003559914F|nr:hypothetical protein MONOS_9942 [Monocercomonoides exilis]|eukprot:MONOS_9942.1-p1 / transcript=MONOS_9942.1 / gene=MONOS_9942 / organism=Monocercomonoides_exilis_PA203 / gene_product=unspecified product / transcript_product=unspecified product / location=Mono_scaffold00429:39268-40704(+) / protein_length=412 / sequence_SO=supercontig / SO=protein_coding / is_pseudo=false